MALWEGRLITNHLCGAFGIGRQQASKDINAYILLHPANLEYDKSAKGYVPSKAFCPAFMKVLLMNIYVYLRLELSHFSTQNLAHILNGIGITH
ncbi:hypothetical protein [Psychromonas sp. Urea-02u-13]|uniref:hypothetical protein n=1 Tax=Psychromonas sp. Urea-02u-13 TaxID=2058326 RepID=UPI001E63ACD9